MRLILFALMAHLLSDQPVRAQSCTPQTVQQLQQRGVSADVIARMCGGQPGPGAVATVCMTQGGSCPFRGPPNVPCTCTGQFGTIQGTSK
jgi:hypothetical protein